MVTVYNQIWIIQILPDLDIKRKQLSLGKLVRTSDELKRVLCHDNEVEIKTKAANPFIGKIRGKNCYKSFLR